MVAVVMFEFSGMRCQPLRRALCVFLENFHSSALIIQT
ncbi:acetyltransferase [Vibrio cholerae]|nr:acetyltransferase [Vibrio cholerae]